MAPRLLTLLGLFGLATLTASGAAVAAQAPAEQAKTVSFDIPAGKLGNALLNFQQQAGLGAEQLGVAQNVIAKLKESTPGVSGALPPREALKRLLATTGLTFLEDERGGFTIRTLTSVYVPGGRCVIVKDSCHEFVKQDEAVSFNVPAGDLVKALSAFKDQSGALAIRIVDAPVLGKEAKSVSGLLKPSEALERLLSGTNVTFLDDGYGIYYLHTPANVRVPGGRCVRDPDNTNVCREQ